MVLPGLRAACTEGRDFGLKKERAMVGMSEWFISFLMICIDDLIAYSFVTIHIVKFGYTISASIHVLVP